MYSYGPPLMAEQKQDDHLEHTYSSYVKIRDVVQKTCRRRWTIGKSGERGSGISMQAARHDDDDEILFAYTFRSTHTHTHTRMYIYILRERERERERKREKYVDWFILLHINHWSGFFVSKWVHNNNDLQLYIVKMYLRNRFKRANTSYFVAISIF